jgi:L-asparaginase
MFSRLRIFTTGGTIDKVYFDAKSEFEIGEPTVEHILLEALANLDVVVEPLMRKDSLDISDADRVIIRAAVEACPESHVLITHGTDTMADTAAVLAGIPGKTIALTGALSPARFRSTDAVFNVGLAIGALHMAPPGVYVAINGRIFDGTRVRKNRPANCFESID